MSIILGIESSCDETAAAVYDSDRKQLLSNIVFSQIKLHEIYGGVVPEIASRSHLEKIDIIVQAALDTANINLNNIDYIAVTNKPGLVGSLLVGLCFAKSLAFAKNKKIIGINHLQAHIFSSFLKVDNSIEDVPFPHICLSASGGSTVIYYVKDFGEYEVIGQTIDDAAGEAFDKVAKIIGFGYPGGAKIEQAAKGVDFQDFYKYPRTKNFTKSLDFTFSGLKTAVMYDLVKKNAYDLQNGPIFENITSELQNQVSSSLLVCMADIFQAKIELALKLYPNAKAVTFVGGVACNNYICDRLNSVVNNLDKKFISPVCKFCADNAAMVAFLGAQKAEQNQFSDLDLDVFK
ncbi:tRNA (adenosine(37)-N6)-threonylcarbamoyltransferase complex transferase subunit TsaD [Candidatus Dependentiae bacterium]|nr:tRNA (adenosine(37)-N6)-threonylcarbamoyltransferase complex transferase subunit TsaD [Candidatus Dependentiae bacterium]MBU4387456.1 tRNA (adenosine(37)-N6)-threonylcarbamoyltransferase complex transferase subunit TsaD [Candidatus Dependentiae bacterium]MCG2756163.1 tRNA (adenosine(37)-N6)-threonylcarbamoyltransferase complex transferase subunit TsaD [Candidatus Dependentiae bacterium]